MPMDVAPDVPVALPDAPAVAPEAPMQIDVAPEAPAPTLYPPAPALEVAAARERAKYQEMQRSLRQEVAMWKKRSQRLSRGSYGCGKRLRTRGDFQHKCLQPQRLAALSPCIDKC